MSSFKKVGLVGIKKYSEIFSALEEFERTKKIPKFTYRKRIDITLDEKLVKRIREYCNQKGIPLSRMIEEMIKKGFMKN